MLPQELIFSKMIKSTSLSLVPFDANAKKLFLSEQKRKRDIMREMQNGDAK